MGEALQNSVPFSIQNVSQTSLFKQAVVIHALLSNQLPLYGVLICLWFNIHLFLGENRMKLFDEGVAEVTLKLLHLSSHKAQFKGLGTLRIMANKQSEDHVHTCTTLHICGEKSCRLWAYVRP